MIIVINRRYDLNFISGFDGCDIIVNFSTYTHAKWMILYSFERWEHALI
jgi:hypothetical protein